MRDQIYAPGAGHMPPELAGRDAVIDSWEVMLNRTRRTGRVGATDTVIVGLRGVGKSALLTRLSELAQHHGYDVIRLQGSAETSLVDALAEQARMRAERGESRWDQARRFFGEISGLSVAVAGVGLSLDRSTAHDPPSLVAPQHHPEQLAAALAELALGTREQSGGGLVLSIDEFQMTRPEDIRLLGGVLNHLNTSHPDAPVVFLAGGLPNLPMRMVGPDPDHPYITNPERLFVFFPLPVRLLPDAAGEALVLPARRSGADWTDDAVRAVLAATGGYPAHLQIYAAAAWARGSDPDPVSLADVQACGADVERLIAEQYLKPRWGRLTGKQRAYLTAIALSGDDAATREVAATLGTSITAQSNRRDALLRRGEIFETRRGRVQLSMPAMREYALRHYPETVAEADGTLITPTEMLANRDQWRSTRSRRPPVEGFPEAEITGAIAGEVTGEITGSTTPRSGG